MLEVFSDIEFEEEAQEIYQEYGIDFETGQLTGEIVTGKEALKVWIYFALKTPRYRYRVFSFDYGTQAEELIGKNYGRDYTESEIKRFITESLTVNPYITGVDDFDIKFEGSSLIVSFRAATLFGDTDITEKIEL